MKSILSQFELKSHQKQAATHRNPAIIVTAGAGSGKTRALVSRYLGLIETDYPIHSLIAITFTDKAAREMRSRIRAEIEKWLNSPLLAGEQPGVRANWQNTFNELDAARIGTIHSLCAEILRAHPAEADVDPNFNVLEEGLAAALEAQAVEAALAWAAEDLQAAQLFGIFKEGELRRILATLLNSRLDIPPLTDASALLKNWSAAIEAWFAPRLDDPAWRGSIKTLGLLQAQTADDLLEKSRRQVLACWEAAQTARTARDWDTAFDQLNQLRKAISTRGRKGNWDATALESIRQAMRDLRQHYDDVLKPLIGGNSPASWALDAQLAGALPAVRRLIDCVLREYQRLKDEQQALDFDDLEGKTAQVLTEHSNVRASWQRETRAVLVDEFQDTNDRQRQIVYALAGFRPGEDINRSLFVVGDAKQSIYKFRGADVTVFRQVQADIESAEGLSIDLDLTFRAHKSLLTSLNTLLAPILGEAETMENPYQVPFAPLRAYRQAPASEAVCEPYIEFHLGLGEDAAPGRESAAAALVGRLHELRQNEKFEWGDMALLFRASTAFEVYEQALERAGIPFVTIAGRGFYDRPEIRDVLNALAAIDDPSDDLALAGLLRSPGFGLSDADLYYLRFPDGDDKPRPLWEALNATIAAGSDAQARAVNIITELRTLAGRAPAAQVLKRFLDLTGYRAILGAVDEGKRGLRNVDKLLADAHRSRLVNLMDFLNYVQTLRDAGAREGEAPVEAEGALQLMTVHKAKGLEFPLVVIADAAYEHRGFVEPVLLDDHLGLLLGLRGADSACPAAWKLGGLIEAEKDEAEDKRLLYVAATRAREKLLVSGHVRRLKAGTLSLRGWLKRLGELIGLDEITLDGDVTAPQALDVQFDGPLVCMLHPPTPGPITPDPNNMPLTREAAYPGHSGAEALPDLAAPLQVQGEQLLDEKVLAREADPPQRVWRVVPQAKRPAGPAWVVGKLVHEALRHWRFPDDDFEAFITPFALEAGLTDRVEIRETIRAVERLLRRFRAHPLCEEIETAERYHEAPYILAHDRGVIDILYRSGDDWVIADFKTDALRSEAEMRETLQREGYETQVQRYAEAVTEQLGQRPRVLLVFLQVGGDLRVVEL